MQNNIKIDYFSPLFFVNFVCCNIFFTGKSQVCYPLQHFRNHFVEYKCHKSSILSHLNKLQTPLKLPWPPFANSLRSIDEKYYMMLDRYYHLFLYTLRDNCHLFSPICHIKQCLSSRFAKCSKLVSICIIESHSLSWGNILENFQSHVLKWMVSTSNYILALFKYNIFVYISL